jgi:hypothetical protein
LLSVAAVRQAQVRQMMGVIHQYQVQELQQSLLLAEVLEEWTV